MPTAKAQPIEQNGVTFYVAAVSGKQLRSNAFVSRRHEDPEEGFNRELSVPRAKEIATYLDSGTTSIPTNIILSAQPNASLHYSRGQITWDDQPDAFLILDGQHRLFGMDFTQRDYTFGVSVYQRLTRRDEVRLFIDINTKQRGVPSALLLDIKQLAGTETDRELLLRELFDHVANDRTSPLKGLMSPAKATKGYVSRTTFNNALRKMVDEGALDSASDADTKSTLVVNYLKAMDRVLAVSGAQRHKLTNATTLYAFFDLFGEVVNITLGRVGRLRPDDIYETVRPWESVDFDQYTGSNNATKAKLIGDLRTALRALPTVTSEMLR